MIISAYSYVGLYTVHQLAARSALWRCHDSVTLILRASSAVQLISMVLSGTAPLYLLSTMYVVAGALLGAPAGVEFVTAIEAAKQVGQCFFICSMHGLTLSQHYSAEGWPLAEEQGPLVGEEGCLHLPSSTL